MASSSSASSSLLAKGLLVGGVGSPERGLTETGPCDLAVGFKGVLKGFGNLATSGDDGDLAEARELAL